MKAHAMIRAMRIAVLGLSALGFVGCLAPYRNGTPTHPLRASPVVRQPGLLLIAGTGIYWASDADGDVFFYDGRWYWCDGPYWYAAAAWGDPWSCVARPPGIFLSIPVDHPRHYVAERHPDHPWYAQYRQTVAVQHKAAPERREFTEIRGVTAPKPAPRAEPAGRGPRAADDDWNGRHGGGKKP